METRQYASLAFPIPVDRLFTYEVPPILRGEITLGMRVKARFRNRVIIGFVVAFVEKPPLKKINPILEIVDPDPLLTDKILKLTRWMADYYYSSWGESLDMALPGGVKRYSKGKVETLVELETRDSEKVKLMIAEVETRSPKGARVLRTLQEAPLPLRIQALANQLKITTGPIQSLIKKGFLRVTKQNVTLDPYEGMEVEEDREITFTEEQRVAFEEISRSLREKDFGVSLLHGVTGSGKTEIYLRSIAQILKEGKGAIVLIPEISLTPQNMKRFKSRFGDQVAVLHSGLTDSQRYHQWHFIRKQEARVVIGPRSAIFAPVENLGLVVVDEEHETSFKEHSSPRYHGRDVAIMRAHLENAHVILGSATPSLVTYQNAKKDKYTLLRLDKRATPNPLPEVEVVDMKKEYEECRGLVIISRRLKFLMELTLKEKNQIILFLNRRGFSTFIVCQRCGYILKCKHCDITLTFHKKSHRAICHYCGYDCAAPRECTECLTSTLKYMGLGTEKIEEHLIKIFPEARISRLDSDTMHKGYVQTLESFQKGDLDILVGTQIIAKGLDFPRVTLVGVISADVGLHMPDFYATERTFQLLTQVAGRAGRGEILGRVVIQTLVPDHYSIETASRQNYESFVERELVVREKFGYPPFRRLIRIVFQGKNLNEVIQHARKIRQAFPKELDSKILGPVACPISQIKGEFRHQILGKFHTSKEAHQALAALPPALLQGKVKVQVDVDPQGML